MSHLQERKEKNCLNCGTQVIGRFCHVCGQENIEPKETIWHLISHLFSDLTHFDSKVFTSIKDLVCKPGFLSREYVKGRRAAYLRPIQMYLLTSAVFFLVFFSLLKSNTVTTTINGKTMEDISRMDSSAFIAFTKDINKNDKKGDVPMTRLEFAHFADSTLNKGLSFSGKHYNSKEEYDSVLRTGKKHHNWFERQMIYKEIELNKKYNNNTRSMLSGIRDQFVHSIPQMLFVLLPIFAMILKLVYIRRKQFYYVDHIIFTIHLYILIFFALLVIIGINNLYTVLHWGWLQLMILLITCGIFFYFYKALRNFYNQKRAKTILKFILLLLLFFIVTIILFMGFLFFSIFTI